MITRSLRLRLLLGGGAAILTALVVAWVFMALLFGRHLERRMAAELTGDAQRLAAAVSTAPGADLSGALTDPRLMTPAGGFYWQVTTDAGLQRSRSLWDETLPTPAEARADDWALRRAAGPFDQQLFVLERTIRPDTNGAGVLIQVARDAAAVTTAQAEFGRELAGFLAALWVFLTAAAWVQVRLGLQPLTGLKARLGALRSSSAARLDDSGLGELKPLTEAINGLADAREADLKKARTRASDLAHGLKTPLSALMAQSRRVRDTGHADIADGLDRAIHALSGAIEAELARSRVAAAERGAVSRARDVVERLISVLEQTDRGERVAFTNAVADDCTPPLAEDDLTELLGPLLENAVNYCRRQVLVRSGVDDGRLSIRIEDDGPGIPSDVAAGALGRGVRLDQAGKGHGLGLAIAAHIAEASGGRLDLDRSALGGLCVRLSWMP